MLEVLQGICLKYILKKNTKKTKIKAKLAFTSSNHKRFIVLLLFKYCNKSNNEK